MDYEDDMTFMVQLQAQGEARLRTWSPTIAGFAEQGTSLPVGST